MGRKWRTSIARKQIFDFVSIERMRFILLSIFTIILPPARRNLKHNIGEVTSKITSPDLVDSDLVLSDVQVEVCHVNKRSEARDASRVAWVLFAHPVPERIRGFVTLLESFDVMWLATYSKSAQTVTPSLVTILHEMWQITSSSLHSSQLDKRSC